MKLTCTCITLLTGAIITSISIGAEHLGPAEGFTVFTIEGYHANHTECTGRVAVGGTATFNSFGIGSLLVNSNGMRDDLIVAENLTWIRGDNFNGNIRAAGPINLHNVDVPNGTVSDDVGIDFSDADEELQNISQTISEIPSNGVSSRQDNRLTLFASHGTLNVFTLDDDDLHQLNELIIDVPEDSSVLVNINENTVQFMQLDVTFIGCNAAHVLFNLPEANSIQLKNISWEGTILAPNANINFTNAEINGALICRSLQGNGEAHHAPFVGYCDCCCHDDDDDNQDDDDDDCECDCRCEDPSSETIYD